MGEVLNIPIQVACVISTQGDISPRWFRYEKQDHTVLTVHIDEIISRNEIAPAGIKEVHFVCTSFDRQLQRKDTFELRYLINRHKWNLYRML